MNKRKIIFSGITFVLLVIGASVGVTFWQVKADTGSGDGAPFFSCNYSKNFDPNRIVIPGTNTFILAEKVLALSKIAGADPDGRYIISNRKAYFTDGVKYLVKPAVLSGKIIFKENNYYLVADTSAENVTDISSLTKNYQRLYAYEDRLYGFVSETQNFSKDLKVHNGNVLVCLNTNASVEFDVASQAKVVETAELAGLPYTVANANGKELPKNTAGEYQVKTGDVIRVVKDCDQSTCTLISSDSAVISQSETQTSETAVNFEVLSAGRSTFTLTDGANTYTFIVVATE